MDRKILHMEETNANAKNERNVDVAVTPVGLMDLNGIRLGEVGRIFQLNRQLYAGTQTVAGCILQW